ncbi:MAG: penicillin acylase family protein [Bacteroidetes bacterium]|nr:penicillin acylase family protein [Bacteroidota bacterium]
MKLIRILFLVLIFILFIIGMIIYKTRPQYAGTLKGLPVNEPVEVFFDDYGIPHIYAQNSHDAYVALGFVHAQERLFQMETLRRAGGGRLSEVFGEDLLKVDEFFRTMGIPEKAEMESQRSEMRSDEEYVKVAKAYLEGVNYFVKEGSAPLEFTIAGIPKVEFTIKDMHLVAGAMSYNFALGLRTDPLMQWILDTRGSDYLDDLLSAHNGPSETIPNWPRQYDHPSTESSTNKDADVISMIADFPFPKLYGSNSWAVAPSRTEARAALFSNDTHIGYSQPCTWYEAHLEYPGQQLYGNFMAGIPYALTGHNSHSAWGLTMLLNDDMDLYCEKLDEQGKRYLFGGQWVDLSTKVDTIKVKGEDDVFLTSRSTHHGPIVTRFITTASEDDVISMQWTFLQTKSDLMEAFFKINTAQSMTATKEGVSLISSPGLNITYADVEGNIALWAAARLNKRPDHVNPMFFLDGHTAADENLGYYEFSENPSVENPPWGYIYSANNQHESSFGMNYPGYYEPPFRADRIVHKLASRSDWSKEAFKRMALDTYSGENDHLRQDLVNIVRDFEDGSLVELESDCLQELWEWSGEHGLEDIGPAIHYRFLYHIMRAAMIDELGEAQFESFLGTNLVKSATGTLICNEDSPWWDDVRSIDDVEKRDVIILKAFKRTVAELTDQLGDDLSSWTWGRVHQTTHKHAFNDIPIIGRVFSVGPFPSPGSIETINNSVFHLSDEPIHQALHGPQMRRVLDMSNLEESSSILPTGQSGVQMSPHYDDQAEMYIKGTYRPQLMSRRIIEKSSTPLELLPQD